MKRCCRNCRKSFHTKPCLVRKGKGHFCSRKCADTRHTKVTPSELFLKHVKKSAKGCWLWTGYHLPDTPRCKGGYGQTTYRGQRMAAHRASWLIHRGPIPRGKFVLHDCPRGDSRDCVRPDHLWLGTHKENMADMVAKNRSAAGERHPKAKLSVVKVVRIRQLIRKGFSTKQVAAWYRVSPSTIVRAVSGFNWKKVA